MRDRPSLAEYLAAPDRFPEIQMTGSAQPRGRRLPMREAPGDTAMRSRTGMPAPTRYERATPALPEGRPEWARALPRTPTPPVERMGKPGLPIGPGGVLTAPPVPPQGSMTPPPTHYRSMGEAQLADAMMMQPMSLLPDRLAEMPAPSGFASGAQSNGMRVPPAPASFGAQQPSGLTNDDWQRALTTVRQQMLEEDRAAGRRIPRPGNPAIAGLFAGLGNRNARR